MIGDLNCCPFQPGGHPSRAEANYHALRKMMGTNGYCENEDSIEAEWRKSKSLGLTCLETFDERATNQNFPQCATDHIILFEQMLGLPVDETTTDEERRQVILPDYTGTPEAWWSALVEQLQRIDERVTVKVRLWANAGTTMVGRAFEAFSPAAGFEYDPNGNRRATQYPVASDMHRINVFYDIGHGVAPDRTILRRTRSIQELLNEVASAWVDFRITYAVGFFLDWSLLDATEFGT